MKHDIHFAIMKRTIHQLTSYARLFLPTKARIIRTSVSWSQSLLFEVGMFCRQKYVFSGICLLDKSRVNNLIISVKDLCKSDIL